MGRGRGGQEGTGVSISSKTTIRSKEADQPYADLGYKNADDVENYSYENKDVLFVTEATDSKDYKERTLSFSFRAEFDRDTENIIIVSTIWEEGKKLRKVTDCGKSLKKAEETLEADELEIKEKQESSDKKFYKSSESDYLGGNKMKTSLNYAVKENNRKKEERAKSKALEEKVAAAIKEFENGRDAERDTVLKEYQGISFDESLEDFNKRIPEGKSNIHDSLPAVEVFFVKDKKLTTAIVAVDKKTKRIFIEEFVREGDSQEISRTDCEGDISKVSQVLKEKFKGAPDSVVKKTDTFEVKESTLECNEYDIRAKINKEERLKNIDTDRIHPEKAAWIKRERATQSEKPEKFIGDKRDYKGKSFLSNEAFDKLNAENVRKSIADALLVLKAEDLRKEKEELERFGAIQEYLN